jgi:hypothetical protein
MSYLSRGGAAGRVLAADAALAITDADGANGTIIVSSTAATKTATFAFDADSDIAGGAKFMVYCAARSGGQYNIAATYGAVAGTVTLDAQHEFAIFQRIGTTLYCVQLTGATFA